MLSTGCHLSSLLPSWWLFWRLWPDYVRQIISRGEPIKVTPTPYSGPFLLLPRLHPHKLPSATHSSHCGLWHVFFHYDGLKFLKPWAKIKPSSLRVLSFLHQSQGTGHWCRRGGVTPVISLTVWSAGWIWKALEIEARDVPQSMGDFGHSAKDQNANCALEVSGENKESHDSWARVHSGCILAKNLARAFLCPENLSEDTFESNGLIYLVEEIPSQCGIRAAWSLLAVWFIARLGSKRQSLRMWKTCCLAGKWVWTQLKLCARESWPLKRLGPLKRVCTRSRTIAKSLENQTLPSKAIGIKIKTLWPLLAPLSLAHRWPFFSCPSLYTQAQHLSVFIHLLFMQVPQSLSIKIILTASF